MPLRKGKAKPGGSAKRKKSSLNSASEDPKQLKLTTMFMSSPGKKSNSSSDVDVSLKSSKSSSIPSMDGSNEPIDPEPDRDVELVHYSPLTGETENRGPDWYAAAMTLLNSSQPNDLINAATIILDHHFVEPRSCNKTMAEETNVPINFVNKLKNVWWSTKEIETTEESDTTSEPSKLDTISVGSAVARTLDSIEIVELSDTENGNQPSANFSPDADEAVLKERIEKLYNDLQVTPVKSQQIEHDTRGQASSELWKNERKGRITASMAGRLFKMQNSTDNKSVLKDLLYSQEISAKALRHGKENEEKAIQAYEQETGQSVRKCGLFVSLEDGIFAGSPDGVVGQNGIVEVKCPISMIGHDPIEMPTVRKGASYLEKVNGQTMLKKSSNYYNQIVMQLHCSEKQYCDFVVYSYKEEGGQKKNFQPFIQRIHRSRQTYELWELMRVKLKKFWFEELAPEIVDPRHCRGMNFRLPEFRFAAIGEKMAKSEKKKEK